MRSSVVAPIREEALNGFVDTLATIGEVLPELNYSVFGTYTMILPPILEELFHFVLPQTPLTGPVWNYLDSACAILVGGKQLTDKTTHRPYVSKAKGLVNIGSGAQLIALTTINFSLLGGWGFAAMFGAGFVLSLDDVVRTGRRLNNETYWLEDSLAQIKKLDELIPKLNAEIQGMMSEIKKNNMGPKTLWAYKKALNQKVKRLKKFDKDRVSLEDDVIVMMKNMHVMTAKAEGPRKLIEFYKTHPDLRIAISNNMESIIFQKDVRAYFGECSSETHKARVKAIKKKDNDDRKEAIKNSVIWGAAFLGMLLVCIPGLQIPGLILVGIASAMYAIKNAYRIPALGRYVASFFKPEADDAFEHKPLEAKLRTVSDDDKEHKYGPLYVDKPRTDGDLEIYGDEDDFLPNSPRGLT